MITRAGSKGTLGWWLGVAACLTALVVGAPGVRAADTFVVVVNDGAGVQNVSRDTVRAILSGRTAQWANGRVVVVVLPPRGSSAATWLCESLLDIPERVYRRFLLEQVYRGTTRAPVQARSLEEAGQLVAGTQGAISVLPAALVSSGAHALTVTR